MDERVAELEAILDGCGLNKETYTDEFDKGEFDESAKAEFNGMDERDKEADENCDDKGA